MFDFDASVKESRGGLKNDKLGLLVLGQSGSGKSTVAGTFGCKTLYLYTTGESHGVVSANTQSANVYPVCLDFADGKALTADLAYQRLLDIIGDSEGIKKAGFGAIVIDGATEVETMIRATNKWRLGCLTDKGKHSGYAEGPVTLVLFRPVIDGLKRLQRDLGIHFLVTCILDVQATADNGEVRESKPRMLTFNVADGVLQQFGDIVVVGRMSKDDLVSHRFQFLAGVSRESKDLSGVVKKLTNFNPRIAGLLLEDLPRTTKADLSVLIELKASKTLKVKKAG